MKDVLEIMQINMAMSKMSWLCDNCNLSTYENEMCNINTRKLWWLEQLADWYEGSEFVDLYKGCAVRASVYSRLSVTTRFKIEIWIEHLCLWHRDTIIVGSEQCVTITASRISSLVCFQICCRVDCVRAYHFQDLVVPAKMRCVIEFSFLL